MSILYHNIIVIYHVQLMLYECSMHTFYYAIPCIIICTLFMIYEGKEIKMI